jgi:hypothetical protein
LASSVHISSHFPPRIALHPALIETEHIRTFSFHPAAGPASGVVNSPAAVHDEIVNPNQDRMPHLPETSKKVRRDTASLPGLPAQLFMLPMAV